MSRRPIHISNLVLAGCVLAASANGSERPAAPLSAEEAVRIGLANNHALALVRDETAQAVLNRESGIGPFLPTVDASANHFGTIETDGTSRTTVGASAYVQLFDGFRSTFAYRRLKTQEEAAGLREQAAVETTVESILAAYYDTVRQKLQLAALREAVAVSRERADLARARQDIGAGSRLEALQALADLNADSSALMTQENALREARFRLNALLARDPATGFDVTDTIPVEAGLAAEAWRVRLMERNTTVREARAQAAASELAVKESRGAYLPSLTGSLNYSTAPEALNETNPAGTDPVTYSLSLSVPLFNGLRTRQSTGTARIARRRQETVLKQTEQDVRTAFAQAEGRYASGLRQIALEERNIEVARQQAEAARERYRVGASSSLEFRDAQQRLLDARVRLAAVRLAAKQSEITLKRLAGTLAAPVAAEN